MFSHGDGIGPGGVGDLDAELRAGGDVDVLIANARLLDELHLPGGLCYLTRDRASGRCNHR